MAETTTDEDVQTEEKKKKAGMSTMTLVGIISGVVALQAIIVFAVFKFFINAPDDKLEESVKKTRTSVVQDDVPEEEEPLVMRKVHKIVKTDDIVINPKGARSAYLQIQLGLEIEPEDGEQQVKDVLMVPVHDRTISILSSYTVEELMRGSLRDSLRIKLKKDFQPYFGEIKLRNVYFPKYIIQ